jgi:lipopolysaccharide export system protein LptA
MRTLFLLALVLASPASAQALKGHNANAPVDFSADRIEVQDRADRVVASGNVKVTQGGLSPIPARWRAGTRRSSASTRRVALPCAVPAKRRAAALRYTISTGG